MRFWLKPGVVVLLLLVGGGCDSAPGPAELDVVRAPTVSDLTFSPSFVRLDQLPADQVNGEIAQVPITISAQARASAGLEAVNFVVQSPLAGQEVVAQGSLTGSAGAYTGSPTMEVPVATPGLYTLLVYAVDAQGQISNELRGSIQVLSQGGGPPVIESVEASPNPLTPPTTLVLTAVVSDPDGLTNVSRVEVTTPNGTVAQLFDDGVSRGDPVGGDGRFTASFNVPSAAPGVQTFSFQAFDRAGLASAPVTLDVTIQ
ncbi:MAG: hypothetical protein RhofKO_21490 [Rhodothermales bacterium]